MPFRNVPRGYKQHQQAKETQSNFFAAADEFSNQNDPTYIPPERFKGNWPLYPLNVFYHTVQQKGRKMFWAHSSGAITQTTVGAALVKDVLVQTDVCS
jgi:hypothetical protein